MSAVPVHAPTGVVPAPRPCPALRNAALALVFVGAGLSLASVTHTGYRVRFAFAYLWAFEFVWAVALGALFFVGLQHLVRAVWSVAVRRVAEMFAASIWVVGILFIPILLCCLHRDGPLLYPWLSADQMTQDAVLLGKRAYLNLPFFVVRAVVFFTLWILFALHFTRGSLKQDLHPHTAEVSSRMHRISAPFMLVFAVTVTFSSIDWLMSLEPRWFSTIFGVYVFGGIVVTALAVITITTIALRSSGRLGEGVVGEGHLYNLGALLFAFVCFWAYIAFSQYMLIWYGNMPEESFYFVRRLEGRWLTVSVALAVVRFAVPFLALLSRAAKSNPTRLLWVSVLVLVGQLLDMYWLIMPQIHPHSPVMGWQELGPPMLLVGAVALHVSHFLKRHPPVPIGDPLLGESQRFYI